MATYGLIIAVSILFVLQKWMLGGLKTVGRLKNNLRRYFKWFFTIAPIIAFAVFAVLFSTVLTGRFYERCSHALILVMLWLFATSFYIDAVIFWPNKLNRLFILIGFTPALGTAVLLTPLERYITLLNGFVPVGVFIIGAMMLTAFYCSIWFFPRRSK